MQSISCLLVDAASLHGERPAVIEGDGRVTGYRDLEDIVDGKAGGLEDAVEQGEGVVLVVEEGLALVVMQLAVCRAGGWFMTLDIGTPVERLKRIALRVGASVIVTTEDHLCVPTLSGFTVLQYAALSLKPSTGRPPSELCYVQHTSGSTGFPKPVPCTQTQIISYAKARTDFERITHNSVLLMASSVTFDPSQGDVVTGVLNGSCLVAPTRTILLHDISGIASRHHVTHITATPSLWSIVDGELPDLQVLSLGGEAMPEKLVQRWSSRTTKLYNVYGVTECTVYQTFKEMQPGVSPRCCGQPLPGVELHVLDTDMCPAAPGEEGCLYISGTCVSSGYIGCDSQSFMTVPGIGVCYATGDICRLVDGDLHVVGRTDAQVKLNGIRIEPSEIEEVINESSLVSSSCVVPHEGQLLAHVVTTAPDDVAAYVLRERCMARLPGHMVPRRFIPVAALPMTANAKIDRKTLVTRGVQRDTAAFIRLNTPLEVLVGTVWEAILGTPEVHAGSDWHDLGGTSIQAILAVRKIRAQVLGGGGGVGWEGDKVNKKPTEASGDAALFLHSNGLFQTQDGVGGGDAECFMGMCEGGTYAPCKLLEHSTLKDYAAYLSSNGVLTSDSSHPEILNKIVRGGHLAALRDVVSSGLQLPKPRKGMSMLHLAAGEGQAEVVDYLIEQGLNPHCVTQRCATPAHLAAAGGHERCLKALLPHTSIGVRDKAQQTILHYAARSGQLRAVEVVTSLGTADLDARDNQYRSAVHWCVLHGHMHVLEHLLGAGAKADHPYIPPTKVARKTRLALQSPVDLAFQLYTEGGEAAAVDMLDMLLAHGACCLKVPKDVKDSRLQHADVLSTNGHHATAQRLRDNINLS